MKQSIIALSLTLALAACGGGGSSSTSPAPTTPTPTPPPTSSTTDPSIVQPEHTVSVGQSTELVLFAPDNQVTNIVWSQTAGEAMPFYARTSKVVGFTPTTAGDYSFKVDYVEDGSTNKSLTVDFTVTEDKQLLTARLGHAVVEGNGVSIISYANASDSGNNVSQDSLTWEQTAGPTVTFTDADTDGKVAIFFDAPNVSKDTVLRFTVSGMAGGQQVSDEVAILVENSNVVIETDGQRAPFTNRVADVFLYNTDSSAGQKLVDCVYSNVARYASSCNFNQTPLIANVIAGQTPTVDEIMDRVVVSHQWMGDQFKKFLETYDEHNDFKNLLRATTAIVLSYDIRPSFYHPYTGAIYLDPSDLWETAAQRDTINQAPDFRAGFGSDLQFEMPWRYVKNNQYANYYSPLSLRLERTLSASLYDFASLLYHELAHANDYFPPTAWSSTDGSSITFLSHVNDLFNRRAIQSDELQRHLPLDENWASGGQNEMTKLGQVRFQGQSANDTQKAFTMEDVANMFKTEGAPQFYSYSSTREDYAILFDGFMMEARYGVARDVAVSDQNYQDIAWGQRGRIGENWIKPRVEFVTARILPDYTEASNIIANLPQPTLLDANLSWRNSITVPSAAPTENASIARALAAHPKRVDPRLVPKDGGHRHGQGRKFVY